MDVIFHPGYSGGALRNIVINEFLANSDLAGVDFIELYNRGTNPVDLTGWEITGGAISPPAPPPTVAVQTRLPPGVALFTKPLPAFVTVR